MVREGGLGVLLLALAERETRPGALTVIVHVLVPLEYPKSCEYGEPWPAHSPLRVAAHPGRPSPFRLSAHVQVMTFPDRLTFIDGCTSGPYGVWLTGVLKLRYMAPAVPQLGGSTALATIE